MTPHAQALMREVYTAIDAQLLALPAMGIRAVIDEVSLDKLGSDAGTFAEKLDGLGKLGHMAPTQSAAMLAVVEAGNAATHRRFIPDAAIVNAMLDALNHMLQSIYVLEASALDLSQKTPKRQKPIKATGTS